MKTRSRKINFYIEFLTKNYNIKMERSGSDKTIVWEEERAPTPPFCYSSEEEIDKKYVMFRGIKKEGWKITSHHTKAILGIPAQIPLLVKRCSFEIVCDFFTGKTPHSSEGEVDLLIAAHYYHDIDIESGKKSEVAKSRPIKVEDENLYRIRHYFNAFLAEPGDLVILSLERKPGSYYHPIYISNVSIIFDIGLSYSILDI
jgi:hypothetical protein